MTRPSFASVFYAGFVLLALGGAVWSAVDDPGQKMRVSLYGKSTVVGDTPIAVNSDGEVGINDGGNSITVDGTVTVTDGAGSLNTIVDSGTLTAVTTITNPVTVTDGAGALNVIVDSGAVTVSDGAGALNVIIDSGTTVVTQGTATNLKAEVIGTGTFAVQPAGSVAFDGSAAAVNPVLTGCYASAAAPTDVDANNDATREWCLRNGARATVLTAAGALVGGDAANGLDVDVTRLPSLVAGAAIIGKVGIDQTTPGTTNLVQITDGAGAVNVIVDSGAVTVSDGAGALNVIVDSGAITATLTNGTTGPQKAEDVASADTDVGIPAMCTRKATAANTTNTDGDYEFVQCSAGRVWVSAAIDTALPAGAALIGKVGIDQTTPGTTNAVQSIPGINTGLSMYNVEPTAGDNHVVIKAGAGNVYHIAIFTKHTAAQYFRLYDATTGFNGCNSATNLKWSGIVPAASTGAGYVQDIAMGLTFATGISICFTGAYGQTDTTAATASVTEVNVGYK